MQAGDVRASTRDAALATGFAERSGDVDARPDAETIYLLQAIIRVNAQQDLRSRLTRLAEMRDTRDRWVPSGSRWVLVAAMLKWLDDFDASRALLTAVQTDLWNRQQDGLLMPALFQLGELECWAGRLDKARLLAELARETELRARRESARPQWMYPAALAGARSGGLDQASDLALESLAIAERAGEGRHQMRALAVLGFVALSRGNAESAAKLLGRVERLQHELGYAHPGVIRSAADHIEALIGRGDLVPAEQRLAQFRVQAERAGSSWGTLTSARCLGLLHAAKGELPAAEAAFRTALASSDHVPDPLERGRTWLALGAVLRRARRRSDARDALTCARGVLGSMGADVWAAMAESELERCQGRGHATPGLTPMETRVADLIAAGRSNKEVAAEVYLSPKTIEAHLSSIYRKLGLRSRTELAAHLLAARREPKP